MDFRVNSRPSSHECFTWNPPPNNGVTLLSQTMSAEEKELLLRRVSKYAGLAEEVSSAMRHI